MGAKLSDNPMGWLGGLLLIAGYGIGFSGFALAVASSTDSSEGYHMMIFLLQLPLLFLSNSLYPLETLPTWMRIGAYAQPDNLCCHWPAADHFRPGTHNGGCRKYPAMALFCSCRWFCSFRDEYGIESIQSGD